MAATTLNSVSLTSSVALDCAWAAQANDASTSGKTNQRDNSPEEPPDTISAGNLSLQFTGRV
jgi:hypothetical protein